MKDRFQLNREFIDEVRLIPSAVNYLIFDKLDTETIVEKEFTHDYLIKNFEISKSTIEFYYKNTQKLITDSEFLEVKNTGYYGKKSKYLKPFSISIMGAFHRRCDLVSKLTDIVYLSIESRINNTKISTFHDLKPYFKDYKEGFKNGYNNFENDIVKKYLTDFSDKQDSIFKVFEFLTKQIGFKESWSSSASFKRSFNKETEQFGNIVGGFEDGQKQGYFYKAWSIVFSANNLFASLFEDYFNCVKDKEQPQQLDTYTPDEKYKTQISFKVGLLFASGEMEKYYNLNTQGQTVLKNEYSAPKVASELGFENYKKYISASINNYIKDNPNGNKNIFNSRDMMQKVIAHCDAENIPVIKYFKDRLPPE